MLLCLLPAVHTWPFNTQLIRTTKWHLLVHSHVFTSIKDQRSLEEPSSCFLSAQSTAAWFMLTQSTCLSCLSGSETITRNKLEPSASSSRHSSILGTSSSIKTDEENILITYELYINFLFQVCNGLIWNITNAFISLLLRYLAYCF